MANIISTVMPAAFSALLANLGESILYTSQYGLDETITAIVSSGSNLSEIAPGMALLVEARLTDFINPPVQGATVTLVDDDEYSYYYIQNVDVDRYGWVKIGCTRKA